MRNWPNMFLNEGLIGAGSMEFSHRASFGFPYCFVPYCFVPYCCHMERHVTVK